MRSRGQEKANFLPILHFQSCTNASVWCLGVGVGQESGILSLAFAGNFFLHHRPSRQYLLGKVFPLDSKLRALLCPLDLNDK